MLYRLTDNYLCNFNSITDRMDTFRKRVGVGKDWDYLIYFIRKQNA